MAWIAEHPWLTLVGAIVGAVVVLNLLACRHAWAMTHLLPAGGWKRKEVGLTRWTKVKALLGGVRYARPQLDDSPEKWGLTSQVHTFRGAVSDLEAWYLPHPAPLGIVPMFHGYIACKARLLPEAKALHDLGYACFMVDFPGCGGSAGTITTIGYREAVDVCRALEYVRHQWGHLPATIFGQSMGAAAVLRALAVHHLTVEAAVLESPFDRLLNTVRARFTMMGVPSFPAAELLVFWGGLMLGYNGLRHDPVTYARHVRCPVLLLAGKDDQKVTPRQTLAVYDALACEKELHLFSGLGHESFAACRPEEWRSRVGAFLHSRTLVAG
jgi:alpha-beta hydrolase superfamily lysophospholipase